MTNQDTVGAITSIVLHSGINSPPELVLINHPTPFWEMNVDEFGNATMNFVIYGLTPANNKQAFAPTVTKYFDADDFLNGLSGCVRADGCATTSYVLAVSDAPSEFMLTYTAGANGSINGTSPQTVDFGADGSEVTAEPDLYYHFVDWSDGSTANPRTDTNVKATVDVTANFEIDSFTVTSSVEGTGGAIAPLGDQQVNALETADYTLTPDEGYLVDDVSGSCGGSLTGSIYTTDPVTENCTVIASFKLRPELVFENGFEDPPRIVFITSTAAHGNSYGGLAGADQTCNTLAGIAGLPGTYAAWLSTRNSPVINAKDRVGAGPWVRTDGAPVADNLADLIDGSIQNPINLDENGIVTAATSVWTGTGGNGTYAGAAVETCWAGGSGGLLGNPNATTDADWTDGVGWLSFCSSSAPIYCFGL